MRTTKLHFIFLLFWLPAFVNAQSQNRDSSNRSSTSKPPKDTTGSGFLKSLLGNMATAQKKRDSLNRYFHDHPAKVDTFVQIQLLENRVVPTTDAIELIKAMNPRIKDLSQVNFYTELRMPHFQNLKRPDKKRLKKERRSLLKYDSKVQNELVTKLDACQNARMKIQNLKLPSSGKISASAFNDSLDKAYNQLQRYRNQNLKKGTALFLIQQADLLTSIMNDVIAKRRPEKGHIDAMNNLYKAVSFSKPYNGVNAKEVSYDDTRFYGKTSSSLWTDEVSFPLPIDLTSSEPEGNVLCYVYAKKPSAAGKEIDIKGQYFFSYQPYGNATYNCRTGTCIGFNEGGGMVSVNGANIIPCDYVFCFRDKNSGVLYYRCITKTQFELITASGNSGDRKKWKILFNPESNQCTDFFNW